MQHLLYADFIPCSFPAGFLLYFAGLTSSESLFLQLLACQKILVLLNFKGTASKFDTGIDMSRAKVLLGNYPEASIDGILKPYELVIYKLD